MLQRARETCSRVHAWADLFFSHFFGEYPIGEASQFFTLCLCFGAFSSSPFCLAVSPFRILDGKILAARTKYVPLFERIAATSSPESDKRPPASFESMGLLKPLSKEEQSRLDALEEDLPAESILMFRTMARNNVSGGCDGRRVGGWE